MEFKIYFEANFHFFQSCIIRDVHTKVSIYIPCIISLKKNPTKKKQKHNKKQPTFKKYNLIQFIDI